MSTENHQDDPFAPDIELTKTQANERTECVCVCQLSLSSSSSSSSFSLSSSMRHTCLQRKMLLLRTRTFAHRDCVYEFIFNPTNDDDDQFIHTHTHDSQNE